MADHYLHPVFADNHGGHFQENMVIAVESLIAEEGSESIKLETKALVTKNGIERPDTFPWEEV
jgi:Xaa-Pro dipeptidase